MSNFAMFFLFKLLISASLEKFYFRFIYFIKNHHFMVTFST